MKILRSLFLALGLLTVGSVKAIAATEVFEVSNDTPTWHEVICSSIAWTAATSSVTTPSQMVEDRISIEFQNLDSSSDIQINWNFNLSTHTAGRALGRVLDAGTPGSSWVTNLRARSMNGTVLMPYCNSRGADTATLGVTQLRAK